LREIMKPKIILTHRPLLFALLASLLFVPMFHHTSILTATAQDISPAGTLQELSIDDGVGNCAAGTGGNLNGRGFGWANKLTPTSYPATLRSVTIGFNRVLIGQSAAQDALYRIVVYADPESDGPSNGQQPLATVTGRVRGEFNELMTFNLITAVTITSGSFVVGAIDDFGFGSLPALVDVPGKSNPRGTESYVSFDSGGNWRTQASIFGTVPNCESNPQFPTSAGSWLIRATVESNPVDVPQVTRLHAEGAVEPWGITINTAGTEAFVANYVSDNLTVIRTATFSGSTLPLGDGTGGTADGPYGVAVHPNDTRAYVTLFGSNTIPSKEFPIDYATVGAGRVAVVTRQQNGTYTQTSLISVGKGPKFPALASSPGGLKLYVPCGGDNRVDVINTTTNEKIKEIAVGTDPSSCTFDAANGKLYVTNSGSGTISVIDTRTDTKIKDITIPATAPPAPGLPPLPTLQNPTNATISPLNNNLYVTYNGASDAPFGAIAEFNTCTDTFIRVVIDETIRGTAIGSVGATGIAAPAAPLTRDAGTGLTPNAGGGGGGPFAIAACRTGNSAALVFTNDGLGLTGVIDARIDQVVTSPPLIPPTSFAKAPKPRGVACTIVNNQHLAFVASGQPDNAILVYNIPVLRENIPDIPVITSVESGKKLFINGKGFEKGSRIEVIDPETGVCLTFQNPPKLQNSGTTLLQKAPFSDGRTIKQVIKASAPALLRVVNPDGSTRFFIRPGVALQ
jgi:YVTN family beta-propeller protein